MNNLQKLIWTDWVQIVLVSILGFLGAISSLLQQSHLLGLGCTWFTLIYTFMVVKYRVNQNK